MRGALGEGMMPSVLRTLYIERRSGMLALSHGVDRASACFIRGAIVYASSNIAECQLGATLVRHGLLTEWDLDRSLEMTAACGKRLGDILLDLGLLDRDRLDDALALQVREVLLTIFSWREGEYEFQDQDPLSFRGYDHPLRLPMGEVILDAVWSISHPDVIRYGLGDIDRVLAPATDPLLRFQHVRLSPADGFLLSRVDGTLTAREILDMVPVSREEAERSLFGLLHTGMVDYAAEAPPARASMAAFRQQVLKTYESLTRKSHHEILGVLPSASAAEIHAAWVRLARLYHPDAGHDPELQDLHGKLNAIFARVNEANRALTSASRVTAPSPPPSSPAPTAAPPAAAPATPAPDAGEALDRAERALGGGASREALGLVAGVFDSLTGRHRRRARVLRAQAYLKETDGRRAAEEELKAAVAEDPGSAEAYFLLGTIYKDGGASVLAAAQFRKVLTLQPRHPGALAEFTAESSPKPETMGLLKRLLRGR